MPYSVQVLRYGVAYSAQVSTSMSLEPGAVQGTLSVLIRGVSYIKKRRIDNEINNCSDEIEFEEIPEERAKKLIGYHKNMTKKL